MEPQQQIADAWKRREEFAMVHYSCGSFHRELPQDRVIGHIVVKLLNPDRYREFIQPIESEEEGLVRFFRFVKDHPDLIFLHWNMTNSKYGFEHFAIRAKAIGINSILPDEEHRFHITGLIWEMTPEDYLKKMHSRRSLN